ncbi:aminomethyltransferase protein [Salinisphaera shabanensis E1L3A]|uniref:Aminomethyltransferase protein n=1 Tax=Salinisphaera shabanensis E1L3A TaxID=1033802 RepID=F7Q881_9GAMM|nr:urea amidolyase associated protein UAAP1 [Salinisphaera shabanensis]ERJ17756.1 aminomethyltransferase protein [Salinisphaera shabanensis E1L3A]
MSDTAYSTHLPGGQHWSLRLRRGTTMTLTATEPDTNVGMLMYNPENLLERLNLPDSLKCQHTFKLTRGNCLYSDMGRIFASIVEDDLGWHDAVGGNLHERHLIDKGWQPVSFQSALNDRTQTGHDSFLIELAKYGLGKRDLAANLNLFSKVAADDEGNLSFVTGHCKAGDAVTLRFEMDTLVALHTCPHPLDPAAEYPKRGVDIALAEAAPVAADDVCLTHCDENARGFENNRLYYLGAA